MKNFIIIVLFLLYGCSMPDNSIQTTSVKKNMQEEINKKTYRIAFIYLAPDPAVDNTIDGYIAGLKENGYIENDNLEILKKHAFGEISNLPTIMQFLENDKFNLIATLTTPVLTAAANILKKTDCVFVHTYDPIAAGAGRNFKDHLPNITGIASFPPIEETMKYIISNYPSAKKIGTVYNAAEPNSVKAVKAARDYLKINQPDYKLIETTVINSNEVYQATQSLYSRGVNLIWITGDNTVIQAIDSVIKITKSRKIPLIVNDTELVERGATAGIGISWYEVGIEAGKMAARVLNGEKPINIPIINLAGSKIIENK